MTLPRHVQAALIDTGVIDQDRVTRRATYRRCKLCGTQTLAALADDGPQVAGIRVDLDPRLLTTVGELQALLAGVATYEDTGAGLTWRCPIRIRANPAQNRPVHHLHRCDPPPIQYRPNPRRPEHTEHNHSGSTTPF